MGIPAESCVSVGDSVLAGQTIAQAAGGISAPLHAPTSGTITAIGMEPVTHPSGLSDKCLTLIPDGKCQWRTQKPLDLSKAKASEIAQRITVSGIVGMGGAGFPSAVKLPESQIDTLIVNGVECEPYITADDMLMREHGQQIAQGVAAISRLLRLKRIFVAIEDNKPEAYESMERALIGEESAIACQEMLMRYTPTQYPGGGEKQLVQMLTGAEVPSGGLPATLGIACLNVATLFAIAEAVCEDKPLVERVLTLTGDAVPAPRNYRTMIGTPVSHLLAQGNYIPTTMQTLVIGGPMMGVEVQTDSVPVQKTTNCIIAAGAEEFPQTQRQRPCIRCGLCSEVCPALLLPQQLYWFARNSEHENLEKYNLFDCIECGACAWVCPSNIPLVHYYRTAKSGIRYRRSEENMAQRSKKRFETHQARIAEEKELMEQRRAARRAKMDDAKRSKISAVASPNQDEHPS
jgi:electron transport complex protein RnfC